ERRMRRDLAHDLVGENFARAVWTQPHHRRSGFVTGRLNAENSHPRAYSPTARPGSTDSNGHNLKEAVRKPTGLADRPPWLITPCRGSFWRDNVCAREVRHAQPNRAQ